MNMRERRMTPTPEVGRAGQAELRAKLLAELAKHNRTTMQLTAILEVERQIVYRALLALEGEGKVTSFKDRRSNTVTGAGGLVWFLGDGRTPAQPPPARDPLLWALFGSAGKPHS